MVIIEHFLIVIAMMQWMTVGFGVEQQPEDSGSLDHDPYNRRPEGSHSKDQKEEKRAKKNIHQNM